MLTANNPATDRQHDGDNNRMVEFAGESWVAAPVSIARAPALLS